MDFLPPQPADVVNVQRLNLAFLDMARHPARPFTDLKALPPEQVARPIDHGEPPAMG